MRLLAGDSKVPSDPRKDLRPCAHSRRQSVDKAVLRSRRDMSKRDEVDLVDWTGRARRMADSA